MPSCQFEKLLRCSLKQKSTSFFLSFSPHISFLSFSLRFSLLSAWSDCNCKFNYILVVFLSINCANVTQNSNRWAIYWFDFSILSFSNLRSPFPPQYPGPDYNIPEHHSPGFIIGKTKREQLVPFDPNVKFVFCVGFASQVSPGPQHPSINIPNMIGTKLPNAPNTKSAIIKNDINPKKQKGIVFSSSVFLQFIC